MSKEHEDLQLRIIDVWPGTLLPHPFVPQTPYQLTDEGVLAPHDPSELAVGWQRKWDRWGGLRDREGVLMAGEIYLELSELDLDDADAVLSFANRWGSLGVRFRNYELVAEAPGFEQLPKRTPGTAPADKPSAPLQAETLEEFHFGARCVRELAVCYRELDESAASARRHRRRSPRGSRSATMSWTVDDFERVLTGGLSPFHPHVFTPRRLGLAFRATRVPAWAAEVGVPLFATCCLELYNHIVEGATHRQCSNTHCQRVFVRQTGRAEHGQHRSEGIKYCSKHCARAQAQREYRARKRAVTGR